MVTLHLRMRYFQDCTPEDIPCCEENSGLSTYRKLSLLIPSVTFRTIGLQTPFSNFN